MKQTCLADRPKTLRTTRVEVPTLGRAALTLLLIVMALSGAIRLYRRQATG
jgi:hypothetical protein